MTFPDSARSGRPPLDRPAQAAIDAARQRAGITDGPVLPFPFPVRARLEEPLTDAELKEAGKNACTLCGGLHPAPNSPACARIRTFELNPDGRVIRGEFWQDGCYDASRILFLADAAEEAEETDGAG